MPNLDKLNFYSGVNYMKRSDASGQSVILGADVVVSHGLGYIPQYVVYADLDGDGFLWYGGERVYEGTESTASGPGSPPVVDSWVTTTALTLSTSFFTVAREIYWLIYLDYGV